MPSRVREEISSQIKEATRRASANFDVNAAIEEGLTGALVDRLAETVQGTLGEWSWRVRPIHVSPYMAEGGEPELGADFVIQVDIYEGGRNKAHKLVPIQAKKQWKGRDPRLHEQARELCGFPGGGIVADYRPGAYLAVRAEDAMRAQGDRRRVRESSIRGLGNMLGDEFLGCTVGTREGYITESGSEIVLPQRRIRIRPSHIARFSVSKAGDRRF